MQVATQKVNSYVQSNDQEPFCGVVEQLSSINNGQRFLTPVMSVQYGSKTLYVIKLLWYVLTHALPSKTGVLSVSRAANKSQ